MRRCVRRWPVYGLACLLVSQPVLARGIRIDGQASAANRAGLLKARNGVPVINIARPNQAGISHNRFSDYNVSERGLVLNNSQNIGRSQLAGVIAGNPNLQSGSAARLIINEVTGADHSRLEGYTEVFGREAGVIVANPNGITCDGCGFINTPRVTLTTGTPEFMRGELERLAIDGGRIVIEGRGLDATGTGRAELLARAIEINANIHAHDLHVVSGRNDFDYRAGTAAARVDDGSPAPAVAIDAAALGGMYADKITLIGTEAGVGFRLAGDMTAAVSDLTLTADGRIELNNAQSKRDMRIASVSDSVHLDGAISGGEAVSLAAARDIDLGENVSVRSGGNIRLDAGDSVINSDGGVIAGADLSVHADRVMSGGGLFQSAGDMAVMAEHLGLDAGQVITGGDLNVHVDQIMNTGGLFQAADGMAVDVGQLTLREGQMLAVADMALRAESMMNERGLVQAGDGMTIEAGRVNNDRGEVFAGGDISVRADLITNGQGLIQTDGRMAIETDRFVNDDGRVRVRDDLNVRADELAHTGGPIQAGGDLTIEADHVGLDDGQLLAIGDMTVRAERILNDEGVLLAKGNMTLEGRESGQRTALIENDAGIIETLGGDLTLRAGQLRNLGAADIETRNTAIRHRFAQSPPPAWLPYLPDYISPEGHFQLWDEGRTQTHVFVPHPDLVDRILAETGKTLHEWSEDDWMRYAPQSAAGFDPEEWVVYVPDEAQHAPPGSAVLAIEEKDILNGAHRPARIATDHGGDILIDAGAILNDMATISAAGDLHIDGGSLTNRGVDLHRRYSLGLSYTNRTVVRALGWSRKWFHNGQGPDLILDQSYGSVPGTIAAGGHLTGSLSGKVSNLSAPVARTEDLSFGDTSSTLIRTQPGDPEPLPFFDTPALFAPAPDTSNYVLETRFEYTDLGTFYGSEYFLEGLLGAAYDPDALPRRLGDAYYDTQAVRRQILDTTGQRFLDSDLTTDAEQVRRLLDGGIAAAGDLELSVGLTLSPEQQAALTDDIIWYVEREYRGETVLVPQVYLARATLDNLDARAGTLSGRNVDIEATTIYNADGRVVADEFLHLAAAGDILIESGRIDGGTVKLDAGRDLAITTGVTRTGNDDHVVGSLLDRRVRVHAKDDLELKAGRNLTISAADVEAGGGTELAAGDELLIGARGLQRLEKNAGIENEIAVAHTIHETTTLEAGGDLSLSAGGDLRIQGGTLAAGRNLSLESESSDVAIDPVADTHYLQVVLDKPDSRREHVRHNITQRTAKLEAGGDVRVRADAGNVSLRAAGVEAGGDVELAAAERVALLSARDRDFEHETFQKDNGIWQKSLDRGHDIETLRHTLLTGEGELLITGGDGVVVEYEDTGSLDDSIGQLARAPGLAWMAELRDRPEIDWQSAQALHDQWHHEAEGLSGPMTALLTTAVAIASAGQGAALLNLTAGTGTAAAANAGFSALVSQASVSLVNNQGDPLAALSELTSSGMVRAMAVRALTAGLLEGTGLSVADVSGGVADIPDNAVTLGLNVLAAENPELGQALMFLYGNWGNTPADWLQNAVGHGMQYFASHELQQFAEKNGLTLGELNLLLALNSHAGLKLAGTTYRPQENLMTGFTTRTKGLLGEWGGYLGVVWDINDTLLNAQGLLDAVSLSVPRSGQSGALIGHSLGAARVNNLYRQRLIKEAETQSLPLFAYPAANSDSSCIATDPFCGFAILTIFRADTTLLQAPENVLNSHDRSEYERQKE